MAWCFKLERDWTPHATLPGLRTKHKIRFPEKVLGINVNSPECETKGTIMRSKEQMAKLQTPVRGQ